MVASAISRNPLPKCFQLIAEITQPLQPIINVENPGGPERFQLRTAIHQLTEMYCVSKNSISPSWAP
ncbi:MAG: hypothetical protein ACLPTZ_09810, partial [Beijerinckiaceae bacterium]